MTVNGRTNGESDRLVAGVDEAGRGPLCGAVVAAAVVLDPARPIAGLNDSKKLTARRREKLAALIRSHALAWSVAEASAGEIDQINILQASLLAMSRAVAQLGCTPDLVRVDGNRCPEITIRCEAIVGGDALDPAISAASILAKTARDAQMMALDRLYPEYGFARHKGYPTTEHLAALRQHGVLECHRRSFAPVRLLLSQDALW